MSFYLGASSKCRKINLWMLLFTCEYEHIRWHDQVARESYMLILGEAMLRAAHLGNSLSFSR